MSAHQFLRKEDVEGKVVIDSSGRTVGKAKEIAFSLDGTLAVVVTRGDNSETQIPISRIMGFSDFVVLKPESMIDTSSAAPSPAQPGTRGVAAPPPAIGFGPATCPQCKSPVRTGAKFCTRCGFRLA